MKTATEENDPNVTVDILFWNEEKAFAKFLEEDREALNISKQKTPSIYSPEFLRQT